MGFPELGSAHPAPAGAVYPIFEVFRTGSEESLNLVFCVLPAFSNVFNRNHPGFFNGIRPRIGSPCFSLIEEGPEDFEVVIDGRIELRFLKFFFEVVYIARVYSIYRGIRSEKVHASIQDAQVCMPAIFVVYLFLFNEFLRYLEHRRVVRSKDFLGSSDRYRGWIFELFEALVYFFFGFFFGIFADQTAGGYPAVLAPDTRPAIPVLSFSVLGALEEFHGAITTGLDRSRQR